MLPGRFKVIGPYVAAWLQHGKSRPPLIEVLHYLAKPGKENRARRYIERVDEDDDYRAITFKGFEIPFFYPKECSWTDLCSTVDESFDPRNWHYYLIPETALSSNDVVIDCGAAEGLFTFIAATTTAKVFAFEPLPRFVASLTKNFQNSPNVVLYPCALGHREQRARISDNQIFSAISNDGPIEVEVKTLDQVLLPLSQRIDFLKADVEGFEFELLLGAEELIRRNKPKIAITVYHRTNNLWQIQEFLARVRPEYNFVVKGLSEHGGPVMLHAW